MEIIKPITIDELLVILKNWPLVPKEKYDYAFIFRQCLQAKKEGYKYLLIFWSEGDVEFTYFNDDEGTVEEAVEEFLFGSLDIHVATILA